jgi:predicted nucleic acid-binding protein
MLVLDSGAVTRLARRDRQNAATLRVLRREGLWPPLVPSVVVVETLTGRAGPDANTNRLLKTCEITTELSENRARRAAQLRFRSKRGSAVDAIVIASAEPGGVVLTGDPVDLTALASHADHVTVDTI